MDDDLICILNFIKFDCHALKIYQFEFAVRKIVSKKIKEFSIKQL